MPKIEVCFKKMLDARKAVLALKEMGYKDAHLDALDNVFSEYSEEINVAGTDTGPSLSALVLNSGGRLDDVGRASLIAASPMVSGMGSFEQISENLKVRLIVKVEDDKMDEIRNTLKEYGASV
ncbi:MAG: hypothetical protein K0R31_313 [Clostridiales bacterium]|jgi:hypothetical protein|nr:hypothetical protein [Clostridiales bacterium]